MTTSPTPEQVARMQLAAAESRARVEAESVGRLWCYRCRRYHAATFVFGGRRRVWHEDEHERRSIGTATGRGRAAESREASSQASGASERGRLHTAGQVSARGGSR